MDKEFSETNEKYVEEIKNLKAENEALKEVIKTYQSHLEHVIEYSSVEKCRLTIKKNTGTKPS